ncbi:hypothetical protein ACP179_05340 [Xenorhabdus stockiae]|uniref:hypothetical protein n=1 Tax=Xenorhabdus stockiae TaxID=351614 RepID=UPI003CF57C3D
MYKEMTEKKLAKKNHSYEDEKSEEDISYDNGVQQIGNKKNNLSNQKEQERNLHELSLEEIKKETIDQLEKITSEQFKCLTLKQLDSLNLEKIVELQKLEKLEKKGELTPDQQKEIEKLTPEQRNKLKKIRWELLKINSGDLAVETLKKGTILYKSSRYDNIDFKKAGLSESSQDEWAGQYFALDSEISKGYDSDYLDDFGNGTSYLHKFKLKKEIKIIENKNKAHGHGVFTQEDKASAIKDFFIENKNVIQNVVIDKKITHEKKLMPTLTENKLAFNGPHDLEDNQGVGQGREIIMGAKLAEENLELEGVEAREYKGFMLK